MKIVVREAAGEDHAEVLRLVHAEPQLPQWTAADLAGGAVLQGGLRRVLLVADEAGAVAGFAQVSAVAGEAELEGMAVDATRRRAGVGRALLQAGMAWAAGQGAALLRLEVRAGNTAAQGLYARMGFANVGVRRRYYRDPEEDAVLMLRKLLPSP